MFPFETLRYATILYTQHIFIMISFLSSIHVNRRLISRNLYAITPCLRHMVSLWQTTYTKLSFINANDLLSHVGTFDLVEFIVSNHQECQPDYHCAIRHEILNA